MKNQIENLEKYISMLENDVPLSEVLEQIDDRDENSRELISLVSKIKVLPGVMSGQESTNRQDAIIHSLIEATTLKKQKENRVKLSDWFFGKPKSPTRITSFVFILSLFVAVFLFLFTVTHTSSASIRITNINGQAEVFGSEKDDIGISLEINDEITAGQKIKTGSNSSMELQLPDQSFIKLAEDTEITIDKLANNKKNGVIFVVTQLIGNTQHQVVYHKNAETIYVIHTPSNIINVYGTKFSVNVADSGRTYIQVDAGLVNVKGADKQVTITPGFATDTIPGMNPSTPLHSFYNYGQLMKLEGNIWEMKDMLIFVSDDTTIKQTIQAGDNIIVSGRILPNGNWLADKIEKIDNIDYQVSFTGNINFISDTLWVVDDRSITVTNETIKSNDLSVGDLVRVVYINQENGRRKAIQIDPLYYSEKMETSINSGDKLNTAQNGLSFASKELMVEGCNLQFNLTDNLVNVADIQKNTIRKTSIDYQILAGKKYVEKVVLEPSFWEEIPKGDSKQFSIHVDLFDDWLLNVSAPDIKLRIRMNKNNSHPDSADGLLIVIRKSCENKISVPEKENPLDDKDDLSEDELSLDEDNTTKETSCVGVLIHPEGQQLANIYGVPYDEIMSWFCKGFGFGEIDLAYYYSQIAAVNVDSIFEMIRSGMEWGEIIDQLGLEP